MPLGPATPRPEHQCPWKRHHRVAQNLKALSPQDAKYRDWETVKHLGLSNPGEKYSDSLAVWGMETGIPWEAWALPNEGVDGALKQDMDSQVSSLESCVGLGAGNNPGSQPGSLVCLSHLFQIFGKSQGREQGGVPACK